MVRTLKSLIKKKQIDWKKGSSELISMAIVLPIIFMLIFSVIGIIQIGLIRQTLEYTTYLSGRAAVVCEDYNTALAQATSAAKMTMAESTFGANADEVTVKLELVGGTSSTTGSGIEWEKGALLKCQVIVPAYEFLSFSHKDLTSTIYMMVERPAKTYY